MGRRRFLAACVSLLAAFSLSGLTACGDDFEPKETWKIWVAQSLRGQVRTLNPNLPVPGTEVDFYAGLEQNKYALLGRAITGAEGTYFLLAEEHPGADAGYWRFIVDSSGFLNSDDDLPVFCLVQFKKTGFEIKNYEFILWRKPQKSLPPVSRAFHVIQNALFF